MQNKEYFYCYSTNLFQFLKNIKKINYICVGLNENNLKKFWQFKMDENLKKALKEYKNLKVKVNSMEQCTPQDSL